MLTIDINGAEDFDFPRELLERAVRATLLAEGVERGEIALTFLSDDRIREMNHSYLGRDYVTDVIAFSLEAVGTGGPMGDIYVGAAQAARQAEELDVPVDEEVVRLAIHGTLHVLGHDHPEGETREESELFRRQESLVRHVLEAG